MKYIEDSPYLNISDGNINLLYPEILLPLPRADAVRAVGVRVVRREASLHAVRRQKAVRSLTSLHGMGCAFRLSALPVRSLRYETNFPKLNCSIWKIYVFM